MGMQFKQAMQQQADALGQSLITQTAASATELLVSNDILSLNVLLNNLAKNPLVAHAAIYSVDNRILAEAGSRPTRSVLGESEGLYSTPITLQEVIAGQLRVSLDMRQFQQPMTISLQSMGSLSLILLALTLSLSMRLGRHISTRQLQARLVPPRPQPEVQEDDFPEEDAFAEEQDAPFAADSLARAQTAPTFDEEVPARPQAAQDLPWDEHDDDPFADLAEEPAPPQQPTAPVPSRASAVLAIQLGGQEQLRRLPRTRLLDLLQRYRDCLEQAAALYQGELHTLKDGSSLMLFHERDCAEDYLTHAICCGELMRALGHALQIEVADSGITLQLQFGLTLGTDLEDLSQGDLL